MPARMSAPLLALLVACGPKAPPAPPVPIAVATPAPVVAGPPALELAETVPVETTLDDPATPDAADAWVALFDSATTRIDLAEFYVSPRPTGDGRLQGPLEALRAAAARGVPVRILADAKFAQTYPDTLEALGQVDGIDVRLYDMKPVRGGVLHAKFFVVDDAAWLGSQNFDWRSLEHIHELGVTVREPRAVADLAAVFAQDWAIAGGEAPPPAGAPAEDADAGVEVPYAEGAVTVEAVASPGDLLPPGVDWDLPHLLDLIDHAEARVRVQLLSYAVVGYSKEEWRVLDDALRAAAGRGVAVELMVSDWSKKGSKLQAAQDLARANGITVKFVAIPDWSGGFIDFARTIHSKYMTVDGARSWVGTSNWSKDYFHDSRNVGLVVEGAAFAADLDRIFDRIWTSEYAETVDPDGTYEPRKVK